jgi:starvation-inducible outer membrane lipoprotein
LGVIPPRLLSCEPGFISYVLARKTLATLVALSLLVSGCIVYPKKTGYDDPECNIKTKRMESAVLPAQLSRGE